MGLAFYSLNHRKFGQLFTLSLQLIRLSAGHSHSPPSEASVQQTGIGPVQPTITEMFLLPFREPEQADTVATRRRNLSNDTG